MCYVQHDSTESKVVKHLAAVTPDIGGAVFSYAFVVKAIDSRYLPRLMIAPNKGHPIGVSNFETEEEEKGFERVKATVDKVAHEEVVCVWYISSHTEQLHEIMKLPMNIAAYCDWSRDRNNICLFYQ